ncbi:MAG: S1C family serine protease [Firmicutes bacterium]|nr:S1C family serine protease [Bacillota bacterium]
MAAKYRIKKHDDAALAEMEKQFEEDAYWQHIPEEAAADLDMEDLAAANASHGEEETPLSAGDAPGRRKRRIWRAAAAAVLLLAFAVWLWGDMFLGKGNIGFLADSAKLAQDESLRDLRSAVVSIRGTNSSGTGFNIRQDGLIVTNRHVVEDSLSLIITFGDGQATTFVTSQWLEIPNVDLALIDIDGTDLPYVELSREDAAAGESVIFIGNPLGFDWTISQATVEGLYRLDGETSAVVLDGPIRPGSSGSPVFNDRTQVIAVIFASFADVEDKGLALPVSYINTFLEENFHE